jgi:single-strand DNA-binding protein
MANVNKVLLIGRLTRDPLIHAFASGGKVANFGFAVTNRKKNMTTGKWEDDPMFIDCKVFNRGEFGKQADLVEQGLHKGNQVFLEGRLVMETWDDKQTGAKRSKHVLYVDNFQFLEPRQDGGGMGEGGRSQQRSTGFGARNAAMNNNMGSDMDSMDSGGYEEEPPQRGGDAGGPPDDQIPF